MIRTRLAFLVLVMILAVSFAMARAHPFGDAGLLQKQQVQSPILVGSAVPDKVREILTNKCADCHSMRTQIPIYGRMAPVSWLLERDINLGRQAMNLDQWNHYSPEQRQAFAAKIVQETKSREMPLLQYRLIHWASRVTDEDVDTLASWAHGPSESASEADTPTGQGDPSRGKAIFEKRCIGCHELATNREGPRLAGVYGRVSGSVGDYKYSPALMDAHILWNDFSLDKWLADPDKTIPGNNMDFLTPKASERMDIIAYLRQSSAKR